MHYIGHDLIEKFPFVNFYCGFLLGPSVYKDEYWRCVQLCLDNFLV